MISHGNFKYLVVETGYTARLIEKLPQLTKKVRKAKSLGWGSYEPNDEETADFNDLVLFIEDLPSPDQTLAQDNPTPKRMFHKVSLQTEEIEKIRKIVSTRTNGIVAFRCDGFSDAIAFINVLRKLNYCKPLGFDNLYTMQILIGEILLMSFDCDEDIDL